MKTCNNCGQQFDDEMNFCPKCGIPLTAEPMEYFCPSCGKSLGEAYESFCPYCGQAFGEINQNLVNNKLNTLVSKTTCFSALPEETKNLSKGSNEYNNGFFGFTGRMDKKAFINKMFIAEALLLFSCYISLLSYWRRLIVINIIWMLILLLVSVVCILGMTKRRQQDSYLTDDFYAKYVIGTFFLLVVAKWQDFKFYDISCLMFIIIGVVIFGKFLWKLFFAGESEYDSVSYKEYEGFTGILVYLNILLLLPIFYYLYKNIIAVPYGI